jgi:hypothetical protein
MSPADKFGWQPFGDIDRKPCTLKPDAVAGSPAAILQEIRFNSEEGKSVETEVNVDTANNEDNQVEVETHDAGVPEKEAPICDGEVPTALILAMAELHSSEEETITLKRWMKAEGELSAVNVVAGRVQDVHNAINAVRRSLMMNALAEMGSPVQMMQSQQPTQQVLGCEVCKATVLKRWKIMPESAGMNEAAQKMFDDVLKKRMIVEPATWGYDIDEVSGRKRAPQQEKGPDRLAAPHEVERLDERVMKRP